MHYPRIPHEYWRDRLKRARAMGLNTVSAYVFWNFHERQPGEFDLPDRRILQSLSVRHRKKDCTSFFVPVLMSARNGISEVTLRGY